MDLHAVLVRFFLTGLLCSLPHASLAAQSDEFQRDHEAVCQTLDAYQNTAERTVYEVVGASWAAGGGLIQESPAPSIIATCKHLKYIHHPGQKCAVSEISKYLDCLAICLDPKSQTIPVHLVGDYLFIQQQQEQLSRLLALNLDSINLKTSKKDGLKVWLEKAAASLEKAGNLAVEHYFNETALSLCHKDNPQRTIAQAGNWVSWHVSGVIKPRPVLSSSLSESRQTFVYQVAACAARAGLLQNLLKNCGLQSDLFSLYDSFWGHTALVVYYNGQEHFVDPTYGGYFLNEAGDIASWREILKNPTRIQKYLTIFPDTQDRYTPPFPRANTLVDNRDRMKLYYSPKNLKATKFYGLALPTAPYISLPAQVNLRGQKKFSIGTVNGEHNDVAEEGYQQCGSYYINLLGNSHANLNRSWVITADKGSRWRLIVSFSTGRGAEKQFFASAQSGLKVLDGSSFNSNSGPAWVITFEMLNSSGELLLDQNRDSTGILFVDSILFEKLPNTRPRSAAPYSILSNLFK